MSDSDKERLVKVSLRDVERSISWIAAVRRVMEDMAPAEREKMQETLKKYGSRHYTIPAMRELEAEPTTQIHTKKESPMSDGFDAAARQYFCATTVEGLDLGLEAVLFRAIVGENLPVDQVLKALERWARLVRDGYFEIMEAEDGQGGDLQFPRTAEGRNFMEKLAFMRRLIDTWRSVDEGRQ